MALTDVGLRYVSKDINPFLKNTDKATNSVTKLNKTLLGSGDSFNGIQRALPPTTKDLKNFDKEVVNTEKDVKELAGSTLDFADRLLLLGPAGKGATKALNKFGLTSASITNGSAGGGKKLPLPPFLGQLIIKFKALPPPVLAATAAISGFAATAFIIEKIGGRAAGLTAIERSFERLRESAGLSSDFIADFADNADNQLSQQNLLIKSNRALAGSTGEFATELGNSLPLLLEFARVRSAATGEDVDFLFESLIQGIKKTQPLILDNLGLTFDLNTTYEEYANTLGKTAEQLTAVEQQQAVLLATNKAAEQQIGILGEATLSNADKMLARNNIVSDILDNISSAVQPVLGALLDMQIALFQLLQDALEPVTKALSFFSEVIGNVLLLALNIVTPAINLLSSAFGALSGFLDLVIKPFNRIQRITFGVANGITDLINGALNPLFQILEGVGVLFSRLGDFLVNIIDFFLFLTSGIREAANALLNGFLAPLAPLLENITNRFDNINETINQTVSILEVGFGTALASLVNVFARAANDILGLVADLAEGIASFLVGQSPPPKGPLSKIDVGGKKTFEAWLDGFASVGIRPVEMVAKQVNMTLGDIGKLSLPQVEKRLEQLDLAIRPFSEQLEIVQARFEAISAPAEAALRAIDRQLETAIKALVSGDESAKASVQALDAQRASLQRNLDLQQQQVDFAQIELALSQAKQAEERALLNIQKKRLSGQELTEVEKEIVKRARSGSKNPKSTKTTGKGGSGGFTLGDGSDRNGADTGGKTSRDLGGLLSGGTDDLSGNLLIDSYLATLDQDAISGIGDNASRIGAAGSSIFGNIGNLPTMLFESFEDGINDILALFGIGGRKAGGGEGGFLKSIRDFFSENGPLSNVFSNAGAVFETLRTTVSNAINGIIGLFGGGQDSMAQDGKQQQSVGLVTTLTNIFGENGTISGILNNASLLFDTFGEDVNTVINTILSVLGMGGEEQVGFEGFLTNLFGEGGTLSTLMEIASDPFQSFFDTVFGETGIFSNIAGMLQRFLTGAVIGALEGVAGIVNGFIDWFETNLNNLLSGFQDLIADVPPSLLGPLANLPDAITFGRVQFNALSTEEQINQNTQNAGFNPLDLGAIQDSEATGNPVNTGTDRNNTGRNSGRGRIGGAARGGLFTGGLLRVGENGEELMASADKMAVFPNNFVTAIKSLESVIASGLYMSQRNIANNSGGTYNTNNNNNTTVNINQPMNPMTLRQQINQV